MSDTSPLAVLLDRAGKVFSLAAQLGWNFKQEHGTEGGCHQIDPQGWKRNQPAFNEFCEAVLDLKNAIQNPPDHFKAVAKVLERTASIAKQIRDTMKTTDGQVWASYLEYFPQLNSVADSGREAIEEVTKAQKLNDPFAFVDSAASRYSSTQEAGPLVGFRESRRAPLPELARDPDRERQSRYCQGYDPDWWVPALVAPRWRCPWYPLEKTRESVQTWIAWVEKLRIEYLGPLGDPQRAHELETDLCSDMGIIRELAPELLNESEANPIPLPQTKPEETANQSAFLLLSVFTKGVAEDKFKQAIRILGDDHFSAGEKLTKIDQCLPIPPTTSAEDLGRVLGVSKQTILKSKWWIEKRKGEKVNEIGRRRSAHQARAERFERDSNKEDDGDW